MFSVKYKADGLVEKYKVCLVAKGFTQTYGIDYEEAFVLVVEMKLYQGLTLVGSKFRLTTSAF